MTGTTESSKSPVPAVLVAIAGTAAVCVAGYLFLGGGNSGKSETSTTNTTTASPTTEPPISVNNPSDSDKKPGPDTKSNTEVTTTVTVTPKDSADGSSGTNKQKSPREAPQKEGKRTNVDLAKLAKITTSRSMKPAMSKSGQKIYYSGAMTVDRNPATGWAVKGDGTAAKITFTWDKPVTVHEFGMINGYAKTDPRTGEDRYFQNRRVVQAGWDFGQPDIPGLKDGEDGMAPFYDDTRKPQVIQTPKIRTPLTTTKLTISIMGTSDYNDPRHGDTVISEIYINGSQ